MLYIYTVYACNRCYWIICECYICKICTLGFRTSCTWGNSMLSPQLTIETELHSISRSPGTGLYHNLQRQRPWERNQLLETSLILCVKDLRTSIQCLGHNGLKVGTVKFRQTRKVLVPTKIQEPWPSHQWLPVEIVVIPRLAWKANKICFKRRNRFSENVAKGWRISTYCNKKTCGDVFKVLTSQKRKTFLIWPTSRRCGYGMEGVHEVGCSEELPKFQDFLIVDIHMIIYDICLARTDYCHLLAIHT